MKLTRLNNLTSGQVYQTVLNNEREGKYLGKTVQVIPHVTDEIKSRIRNLAEQSKADVDVELMSLSVCPIDSQIAPQIGLDQNASGVLVTRHRSTPSRLLSHNSNTHDAELQTGDVIDRFAGIPIRTPTDLDRAASRISAGNVALVEVLRKDSNGQLQRIVILWQRATGVTATGLPAPTARLAREPNLATSSV